ncbi:programmed cell death protein 6-like [Daphnia pulicaria]|uniref:programmed cell death protein 6-like n=1 Tax=Daphnia pulicaria TaxID=35523 RepID=UPI001EEAF31E|nr:programmed cell death protein 6-like [Daphnia pulicaria]
MYSSGSSSYGYQTSSSNGPNPAPTGPQEEDLIKWFQAVDQDKSGKISSNELRQALVVGNGSHFSIEACELLVKMFSSENSRMIDVEGFKQLFHYVNQWKTSFHMFDRDHSGAIDEKELGQALVQMGYRLSDKSVTALLNKFTSKPAGQITFDNFILACVQLHQLTDVFRRHDTQHTGTITIAYEDFIQAVVESI